MKNFKNYGLVGADEEATQLSMYLSNALMSKCGHNCSAGCQLELSLDEIANDLQLDGEDVRGKISYLLGCLVNGVTLQGTDENGVTDSFNILRKYEVIDDTVRVFFSDMFAAFIEWISTGGSMEGLKNCTLCNIDEEASELFSVLANAVVETCMSNGAAIHKYEFSLDDVADALHLSSRDVRGEISNLFESLMGARCLCEYNDGTKESIKILDDYYIEGDNVCPDFSGKFVAAIQYISTSRGQ